MLSIKLARRLKNRGLRGGERCPAFHSQCYHDGFQNLSCMAFKTGVAGEAGRLEGGGGGQPPPPLCKHNGRMMGFNRSYALKQDCTALWGIEGRAAPPCKHSACMMGAKKTQTLGVTCSETSLRALKSGGFRV